MSQIPATLQTVYNVSNKDPLAISSCVQNSKMHYMYVETGILYLTERPLEEAGAISDTCALDWYG